MSLRILAALVALVLVSVFSSCVVLAQADFGDAPDPSYPSLRFTPSSRVGMPGPYHMDISQEWFGPPGMSTTTPEPDAMIPDADMDDGNPLLVRTIKHGTHSNWGFVRFDIATSPTTTAGFRYINVAADLNTDGIWATYLYDGVNEQPEWIVQNAEIYLPDRYFGRLGLPFWFPDLAADARPGINLRMTLSTEPLDPALYGAMGWDGSGLPAGFVRGETEDWMLPVMIEDVSAFVDNLPSGLDKGAGDAQSANVPPSGSQAGATTPRGYQRTGVPDNNQGTNECAPTSAANSLQWLAGQHGFTDRMPAGGTAGTVGELKKDMAPGYTTGAYPGIAPSNFLPGKNKFTQRHGLPIASTAGGNMDGTGTFEFIEKQLQQGADVEMRIQYQPAPSAGGHWVTVVGFSVGADGKRKIHINDPLSPGPASEAYEIEADGTIKGYPYGTAKISFAVAENRVIWGTASNFDVMNHTGQQANDFEVKLGGVKPNQVKGTYTGALGYNTSSTTESTGGTTIRWTGGTTAPGVKSHFGYVLPKDVAATSVEMTWTKDGVVISTLPSSPQTFKVKDSGGIQAVVTNNSVEPMLVQRSVAMLPTIIPLDDLNVANPYLASMLVPIDPAPILLGPHQDLVYDFESPPEAIQALVFAYGVHFDMIPDSFFDVFFYNEAIVGMPQPHSSVASLKHAPESTLVTLDSPTLVVGSGGYRVDSFFDVFLSTDDRAAGLAVSSNGTSVHPGDRVTATGTIHTIAGMRVLDAYDLQVYSSGDSLPQPLAMPNRALGGHGVSGLGLDNTGLLVTAWGRVVGPVPVPPGYLPANALAYAIDDGSGTPTAVAVRDIASVEPNQFVAVRGVSCSWAPFPMGPGNRLIIPNSDDDITVISHH